MTWPSAEPLRTARFLLEPLSVEHALEMVEVLGSESLYTFTGGEPPTFPVLQARYARQARGRSADGEAGWLNWIIRDEATGRAIGFVQSTLTRDGDALLAEMAWLVAAREQGRGAAVEASAAVLDWLRELRPRAIRASIHPDHTASARVAERLGLTRTSASLDGEEIWQTPAAATPPPPAPANARL